MEVIAFWKVSEKPYGCFSQWYKRDMNIDGKVFNCCEQYMMYSKAILFKDFEVAEKILKSSNPKNIKALGRQVKNFDSGIWNQNKEYIVYKANYEKFSQHEDLKNLLVSTRSREIVEASPLDKIWGIGLAADNPGINDITKWKGKNLLGKALMNVRAELE